MLAAIWLSVAGIIVGAIISILISRHFYRRTFQYRLAIYCIGASQVFSRINAEIRSQLKIEYLQKPVADLTALYLLVANEGVAAIKDVDEPLSCMLPENITLATEPEVIHVSPAGRDIHLERSSPNGFSLRFSTFNPTEFFVLKIIADGSIIYQDLSWTITAENLPPRIRVEDAQRIAVQTLSQSHNGSIAIDLGKGIIFRPRWDYSSKVGALSSRILLLASGLSVFLMLYFVVQYAAPAFNLVNVVAFLLCLLSGFALAIVGLVGVGIIIVSLSRPRKRFSIPQSAIPDFDPKSSILVKSPKTLRLAATISSQGLRITRTINQ